MGFIRSCPVDSQQKLSLDDLLQRFAISALSKERKEEAITEEILVGKYTGEFFIKSKDNVIISADILNRLKCATEAAIKSAESIGMVGDLYRLDFDNIQTPTHVDYNVNLIENEHIEINEKCKYLLFNFDFDEFDVIGDTVAPVNTDAMVQITVEVLVEGGNKIEFVVEKSIQSINHTKIDLKKYYNMISVEIKNITINKDDVIFNDNANYRTIILHNIFMTINK